MSNLSFIHISTFGLEQLVWQYNFYSSTWLCLESSHLYTFPPFGQPLRLCQLTPPFFYFSSLKITASKHRILHHFFQPCYNWNPTKYPNHHTQSWRPAYYTHPPTHPPSPPFCHSHLFCPFWPLFAPFCPFLPLSALSDHLCPSLVANFAIFALSAHYRRIWVWVSAR